MSGPITAIIIGDPITALLSAAGIRAAEAVYAGYARAAALRGEHEAARDTARAVHRSANRQGRAALEHEIEMAEARFEQLIALADQLGAATQVRATRPVRPEGTDTITLAAYARALGGLADELQAILVMAAARLKDESAEQAAEFEIPADAVQGTTAQRLLARIAHLGPPPEQIAALAKELDATLPGERAALLAMELGQRIQLHLEDAQQRLVQEATATIVRQSLKDLGYQVEDVEDTLFVEGGVMHFRRPGWGDYMVRMRADPRAKSVNFNVVRAIDADAGSAAEASVLDHIAEDRWCAEFPALLNAMAARGVRLDVTRRLEAGELPVQLVARDKLPAFPGDDAPAPTAKPRARSIR